MHDCVEYKIFLEDPSRFERTLVESMSNHGFVAAPTVGEDPVRFLQDCQNQSVGSLNFSITSAASQVPVKVSLSSIRYPDFEITEWEHSLLLRVESVLEQMAEACGLIQIMAENRLGGPTADHPVRAVRDSSGMIQIRVDRRIDELTFHRTPKHRFSRLSCPRRTPANRERLLEWASRNEVEIEIDPEVGIVKIAPGQFGSESVALLASPFCGGPLPIRTRLAMDYRWPPDAFLADLLRKCQGPFLESLVADAEKECVATLPGVSLSSLDEAQVASRAAVTKQVVRFHPDVSTYSILRCYDDGLVVPTLALIPR